MKDPTCFCCMSRQVMALRQTTISRGTRTKNKKKHYSLITGYFELMELMVWDGWYSWSGSLRQGHRGRTVHRYIICGVTAMPWFGRKLRGVQNPENDVTEQLKLLTSANISQKQRKQPKTATGIETVHPRGFETCEVNMRVKLEMCSHDVHILFTVASHLFRIGFTYVGKAVQYHGLLFPPRQ